MNVWEKLAMMAVGVGAFLLAHGLLSWLVDVLRAWRPFQRRGMTEVLRMTTRVHEEKPVALDDLLGRRVPWTEIILGVLVVSVLLAVSTNQPIALSLTFIPMGVRSWLHSLQKRRLAGEVWQFLLDLRIRLPLRGSLLLTLQDMADDADEGTALGRVLKEYFEHGFQGNGLDMLTRLAEETQAPYLADAVARTKAAHDGALALDEALKQSLERIRAEIRTDVRERLQQTPARLVLLSFPLLLGPGLVAVLYPLVARVLASLSGAAWVGGF